MSKRTKLLLDQHLVLNFLEEHPDYYDWFEKMCIKSYAEEGSAHDKWTKDVIREIYDELGLIPEDKNMYIEFIKLLEETFGIEGKNIIEVGGGIIPRLGKRIHLQQHTGSITVYDPRLGNDIVGEERFILRREKFNDRTPVDGTDVMIGLMPCKGAEALIASATKHNIDFLVWLCEGGPHGDCYDYFEDEAEWLNYINILALRGIEDNHMGKLMVKRIDELSEYPIIYNQR